MGGSIARQGSGTLAVVAAGIIVVFSILDCLYWISLLSKLLWYQDCIGILGYRNAGINSASAGMKKEIWLLVLIALFYKTQIQPKLYDRVK